MLLLSLAAPAAAQEAARPGADEYTRRIQQGIQLLLAGDSSGAQGAFRDAVGLDGDRPMALYYLATANRLSGNLEDYDHPEEAIAASIAKLPKVD